MTANDNLIVRTEEYVKHSFDGIEASLSIAHDFKHVDRVRNWALVIAQGENYPELEFVEITALLHDIGLAFINDDYVKTGYVILPPHGPLGADIAAKFLENNSNFPPEKIKQISDAIRHHSATPLIIEERLRELGEKGKLIEILRDADTMDALGAVGLMRALTSKSFLPEYDPKNIKGEGWNLSPIEFKEKFGFEPKLGLAPVNTIIDQINQQIRYYDHFHTLTAKSYGTSLVEFMRQFVIELDNEIAHS